MLDHYDATAEEKQEMVDVMVRGNTILRNYHERVKAALGVRYSLKTFRKELFDFLKKNPGKSIKIHGIGISKNDIPPILKVQSLEYKILCSYSKLYQQMANRWSRSFQSSGMIFEDFYNEAVIAAIAAIYAFNRPDIKFITFLQVSIQHRFEHVTNYNRASSPLSTKAQKMCSQYRKTRNAAGNEQGREVSFDEVCSLMNLDASSANDLRHMLTSVVNHTDLTNADEHYQTDDFLAQAAISDYRNTKTVHYELREALQNLELSPWERTVLDAFLVGQRGWQSEVARTNINPVTNEPYSRRAPRLALERILELIMEKAGHLLDDELRDATGKVFAEAA